MNAGGGKWPLTSAILLTIVARCTLLLFSLDRLPDLVRNDAAGYWRLGTNLYTGHGLSLQVAAPFLPDAFRTPGYPAFLAGVFFLGGHSPVAVALVQIAFDALTCGLLYHTVRKLGGGACRPSSAHLPLDCRTRTSVILFWYSRKRFQRSWSHSSSPRRLRPSASLRGSSASLPVSSGES